MLFLINFLRLEMETNISQTTSSWPSYCNGNTSQASPNNETEPVTHKRSWTEIKESVNEIRKQLSRLSAMTPSNIEFRKLTDNRTRIYFLGTPPNGWETTLLCTDITPDMLKSYSIKEEQPQPQRTRLIILSLLLITNRPIKI